MNSIFNSVFENSLKVVLLLKEMTDPATADRVAALDFITTYAGSLGTGTLNLNGDNVYMYSEFTVRRRVIKEALKDLVLFGYVDPEKTSEGIVYQITEDGIGYAADMQSDYAKEYSQTARCALERYGERSERELLRMIAAAADQSLEKAGIYE